jgi:aminoglycoside phosphotransferase (APT) family kinase protein
MARRVAYWPEAGLLLQAPVPGRPIQSNRNRRLFMDLVRHAGQALAAVHSADLPFGPEKTLEALLGRLHGGLDDLAYTAPPLHETMRRLIGQIEARAARTPPVALVPSHGDFKWDQFLEANGRFSLIDFEFFCHAEPGFDLGSFCAYLQPSRPRDWQEGTATDLLRAAFLNRYSASRGEPLDLARFVLYEAAWLGLRALSFVWQHQSGWTWRVAELLEVALDRLVDPTPKAEVCLR